MKVLRATWATWKRIGQFIGDFIAQEVATGLWRRTASADPRFAGHPDAAKSPTPRYGP
jgi:hypothetical protein